MSKIGPKEAALKAQRESIAKGVKAPKHVTAAEAKALLDDSLSKAHKLMIEDGLPAVFVRTGPAPKIKQRNEPDPGVKLAEPLAPIAVRKAIERDLAEEPDWAGDPRRMLVALGKKPPQAISKALADDLTKAIGHPPTNPVKPSSKKTTPTVSQRAAPVSKKQESQVSSTPKKQNASAPVPAAKKAKSVERRKLPRAKIAALPKAATATKPAQKGKRIKKHERYDMKAALALVEQGKLPPKPDFSAWTHRYYAPHLDAFEKLAKAGDLKGLRAYKPHFEELPYCGSRTPLVRYRDNCIRALQIRAKQ